MVYNGIVILIIKAMAAEFEVRPIQINNFQSNAGVIVSLNDKYYKMSYSILNNIIK